MKCLTMNSQYVSIDEMLTHVGEFKLFQWLLDLIFCIMMLPQTFQILIMYFAALSPEWRCAFNSTICNSSRTFQNTDDTRCSMPRHDWEYTQSESYSIVTQFDLSCKNDWQSHLTTSIMFISWGVGAVVLGWFADNYGRKSVIFPSISIIIIGGFVTSFSPNIYWFLVFRFIVGFFVPGTSVQEFILISELVGNRYRPLAGIIMWIVFTVALCLLGLKAYLIREWKYLYVACTVPYIFVISFYKFVPESVRWLNLRGETEKAMNVFHRMCWWNKTEIPADVQIRSGTTSTSPKHKSSPLNLFKTTTMIVQTLVQGYAWFVMAMVYYGLSLAADDLGGSLYRNYVLVSVVEFPANLLAVYCCERFGRKRTVLLPTLIGSVCCIAVAFIPNEGDAKIGRIVVGMFGKLFITVAFSSIYSWSVELIPTSMRGEGMGFLQVTSRIGAATSPWIAKGLRTLNHMAPFILMGVSTLLASGLMLLLPETKNKLILDTEYEKRNEVELVKMDMKSDRKEDSLLETKKNAL